MGGSYHQIHGPWYIHWDTLLIQSNFCIAAENISGPVMLEQYVAIADYKKQNRNEVSMVAGDIVEVIDKNENGKFCILYFLPCPVFEICYIIVIRGDWLWKAANINDKNNSAAVYVQSTVKVHNPLFSVGKLLRNKLMQRFYWSIQSKW